jgi:hypothetical protein
MGIEVKHIFPAKRHNCGIDMSRKGHGYIPALVLQISFERDMVCNAVVYSHPRRVDNRTRAYVLFIAENVVTKIVNGAFGYGKIGPGAESTHCAFDYRSCNKAFLFIHVASHDCIGTPDLYDGTDAAKTYEGDVSARGDSEILSLP